MSRTGRLANIGFGLALVAFHGWIGLVAWPERVADAERRGIEAGVRAGIERGIRFCLDSERC